MSLRQLACALVFGIGLGMPAAASADEVETAGALYDRAVTAQKRGDYARAATLFARADELVPDAAALEAALSAAILADDPVLGMALVKRSARGPTGKSLATAVRTAQSKFADRVGLLRIKCSDCEAMLDGSPATIGDEKWVMVGSHSVELTLRDRTERHAVSVRAGEVAVVVPKKDPTVVEGPVKPPTGDPVPGEKAGTRGISPAWFWAGAGLTVVFGAFAIGSGVDTLHQYTEFKDRGSNNKSLAADGQDAETRTYVLFGIASGLAVTTVLVGAFAVRWDPPKAAVSGGVSLGPGTVTGTLHF